MSTPYDPPGPEKRPDEAGQPQAQPQVQPGFGQGQGYGPGYGGGSAGPLPGAPVGQQTNGVAVASLVLGIMSVTLGWCCVLFALAGPAAVVLGKQGQRRADASGGLVGGRGMASAGFILGIIGTVVLVLGIGWIIYVMAQGEGFSYRFDTSTSGSPS
jgi:Domain of unknown function (DUF4190)